MLNRRELNRAALWLALSAWTLPCAARAQEAVRWQTDPFSLGVASGMPRPGSVVLWTRLAPVGEEPAERDAAGSPASRSSNLVALRRRAASR